MSEQNYCRCKACGTIGTGEDFTVPTGGDDYVAQCPACYAPEGSEEDIELPYTPEPFVLTHTQSGTGIISLDGKPASAGRASKTLAGPVWYAIVGPRYKNPARKWWQLWKPKQVSDFESGQGYIKYGSG